MVSSILDIQDLGYCLESRWLLQGVSLSVANGECVAVVGPNGAGKSTLFRLLSGEWHSAAGIVHFNGRLLSDWSTQSLAQVRAVLPQTSSLQFPFSVKDVVRIGRMPHSSGFEEDSRIAHEAMTLCDVLAFQDRPYTQLSGGERQRVQLARVLSQVWLPVDSGQRLLLLDEPTSALDMSHQIALLKAVRQMCQQGVSCLVILHDLNLASRFADRILMLHQGRQVALGNAQEVLRPDLLQSVFEVEAKVIEHPMYGCPLVVS